MKQLYMHNIMPKHENNALQKKFTIYLKRVLFLSSVLHALGTPDMSMGYSDANWHIFMPNV